MNNDNVFYAEVSVKRFSSESMAQSRRKSKRSPSTGSGSGSSKGQKSTAKTWFDRLLYIAGAVTTLGGAYAYLKDPFKDYESIENISSVSAKEHYLPRAKEMKMMEAKFIEVENRWRKANPQAKGSLAQLYLTGKPGSGKTQLALGYARKFYEDRWFHRYMFSRVAVVHLDASNLDESYPKVLELLHPGIDTKHMTLDEMRTKTEGELRNIDCWLLVVDNVNSSDMKFPMPNVVGRQVGRILLVTSNRNVLKTNYAAEHKLERMTEEEAIHLLQKTSRYDGRHDEASALINFLGLVPLSIARYKKKIMQESYATLVMVFLLIDIMGCKLYQQGITL